MILGALIPAVAVHVADGPAVRHLLVVPVATGAARPRAAVKARTCGRSDHRADSHQLDAAAAVAIAVRLFGQEAVVFADSGSYKTLILRRYARPAATPTLSQALLLAALWFPVSFYAQSLVSGGSNDSFVRNLVWLAVVQFAGCSGSCAGHHGLLRIDVVRTFRLGLPPVRGWLAAIMLGARAGAGPQFPGLAGPRRAPSTRQGGVQGGRDAMAAAPLWQVLLLLAVVRRWRRIFFPRVLLRRLGQGPAMWSPHPVRAELGSSTSSAIHADHALLGICLACLLADPLEAGPASCFTAAQRLAHDVHADRRRRQALGVRMR